MPIRWLHISDVHERSRDGFHRVGMYEAIVKAVSDHPDKPDFVFFTGDLAFSGKKEEYILLKGRFFTPLRTVLPDGCPIFTVPGNHDVDRNRSVNPRTWMENANERQVFQQVDAAGRQKRADAILPRFEAYREVEKDFAAWGEDWLESEMGTVCTFHSVGNRRLAVVGINTAWLCHDDEDWGRLTAGSTMVDAALRRAATESPDLTIVLGHHPLDAMTGEKEWSDGGRIRTRLEQANAVYLHGHLHRSGGQKTGDSMKSVLAIQAPSGFQAGDSSVWRNGIMWGEADIDNAQLIVEPLRWNDDHLEFVFDTDAAPSRFRYLGRDAFVYPLPGQLPSDASADASSTAEPDGWQIIDAVQLAEMTAQRPSVEEMADWFDGTFPRWEVATAQGVRPRQIVDRLVRLFETAHDASPKPVVRLLTGAGGEGKSAALLQTAASLMRGAKSWTCLRRQSSFADLPTGLADLLPRKEGHAWIIAVDDAENVAIDDEEKGSLGLITWLRSLDTRTDVHLVLAARDADWTLRGLTDADWMGVADFQRVPLAGLNEEDARRIVGSWAAWGDAAMGKLRGLAADQAATALLGHAKELAAREEEGALLGALLKTREGEDYRQRVARLMEPMRGAVGIGSCTLLDIYAMIAAMHADNQLYLSRAVLARALRCKEEDLERGPLRTLRREAMVDGGSTYILTRHRLIAEVARDWLVENGHDIDRLYPMLALAAQRRSKETRSGQDVARWQFDLSRHFIDRGEDSWPVARAVAKALWQDDPNNYSRLTHYARTLRLTDDPGGALALFWEASEELQRRRDVLFEMSVCAGAADDDGLAVWFGARSLADDRHKPFEPKNAGLSLAGLGAAFRALHKKTGQIDFAKAQAACGRLGLQALDLDDNTRGYLEKHAEAIPAEGDPPSMEADLTTLRNASLDASYECAPENVAGLDKMILEPDSYTFKMLTESLSETCDRPQMTSGSR